MLPGVVGDHWLDSHLRVHSSRAAGGGDGRLDPRRVGFLEQELLKLLHSTKSRSMVRIRPAPARARLGFDRAPGRRSRPPRQSCADPRLAFFARGAKRLWRE
jgi:hypothetical protein